MALPVLFPGGMNTTTKLLLATTLLSTALAGCEKPSVKLNPVGYWEGTGSAIEIIDSHSKHFSRGAKVDFWFDIDESGDVKGEAQIDYSASFNVDLPSLNMAFVAINPTISGGISPIGSHRKIALVGAVHQELVTLQPVLDDEKPLTFTLTANAGVSAGNSGGAFGVGGSLPSKRDIKIDMKPFDPFSTAKDSGAELTQHGNGPWSASFDAEASTYAIHWRARQVAPEARSLTMTPNMKHAIDALRAHLDS